MHNQSRMVMRLDVYVISYYFAAVLSRFLGRFGSDLTCSLSKVKSELGPT